MPNALKPYLAPLFGISAILILPFRVALASPLPSGVSLEHGSRSFTAFPDQVAGTLVDPDHFLEKQWACPSADVVTFPGGSQLAVCGAMTPIPSRAHAFLVEPGPNMDLSYVVSRDTGGATELLFVGGGWAANPNFIEIRRPDSVSYIEGVEDDSKYFSIFATLLTCGDSCHAEAETCHIDIPRNLYRDVAARARRERIKGWSDLPLEKQQDDSYTDLVTTYSHRLLMRALVGDEEAARLLLKSPFQLDGASAEIWDSDTQTYRKAERLGCVEPIAPQGN